MSTNMFIVKDIFMHKAVYKYLVGRNVAISHVFRKRHAYDQTNSAWVGCLHWNYRFVALDLFVHS